jgi:hypothetical protein
MFNPNTDLDAELGTDEHPCPGISTLRYRGLSFREGGDSISGNGERILYYYDKEEGKIYRRIGTEQPESIVSSGIYIRDFQFIVSGTEPKSENPGSPDTEQPTVTILIDALDKKEVEISGGGEGDSAAEPKSYKVQTTVTQRIIDI